MPLTELAQPYAHYLRVLSFPCCLIRSHLLLSLINLVQIFRMQDGWLARNVCYDSLDWFCRRRLGQISLGGSATMS